MERSTGKIDAKRWSSKLILVGPALVVLGSMAIWFWGLEEMDLSDQYYGKWTDLATAFLIAVIFPGIVCIALGVRTYLRYRASPAYAAEVDARRAMKAAEVQNREPQTVVKERETIREREIVKVKCSYCGTLNPQEAQKCSSCGARI